MKTRYPDANDLMPLLDAAALTLHISGLLTFVAQYATAAAESDEEAKHAFADLQARLDESNRGIEREFAVRDASAPSWKSARAQCVRHLKFILDALGEKS